MMTDKQTDKTEKGIVNANKTALDETPQVEEGLIEFSFDEAELIDFRKLSIFLVVMMIVLHLVAGFVNNPGMYQFYIALPYAIVFLPLWHLASSILRLPKVKRKFKVNEFDRSFGRMKPASYVIISLIGVELIGQVGFRIFNFKRSQIGLDLLFFGLEILVFGAIYFLIQSQKNVQAQSSLV